MPNLPVTDLHQTEPLVWDHFVLRAPEQGEVDGYVELSRLSDTETHGHSGFSRQEAEGEWAAPDFELANDFRYVIDTRTMMPVGYGQLHVLRSLPVRPWLMGYVRPEYRRQGVGTVIARWCIDRAKRLIADAPENARVVAQNYALDKNTAAAALFKHLGYGHVRSSYTMMIHMDALPSAPVWPEGITVTSLAETPDLRLFVKTNSEGFRDHRGYIERPLDEAVERWAHHIAGDPHHDSALYLLARHGDTPAGNMFAEMAGDFPNTGWIGNLAVLPPFRRQGLGVALLHYAFGLFWARGIKSVALGVDGSSLTNAVALYQRAGMHIHQQFDIYELELRPGEEMTPQ